MSRKDKFAKWHNNDGVVDGDTWLLLLRPVLGQVPCSKDSTPLFSFGPSRTSQDIHAYSHIHAWTLLTVRLWTYQDIVNAPINQSKTNIQLKPICHRLYTFYTPRVCLWWASWTCYPLLYLTRLHISQPYILFPCSITFLLFFLLVSILSCFKDLSCNQAKDISKVCSLPFVLRALYMSRKVYKDAAIWSL
jgi:hypothetical protein